MKFQPATLSEGGLLAHESRCRVDIQHTMHCAAGQVEGAAVEGGLRSLLKQLTLLIHKVDVVVTLTAQSAELPERLVFHQHKVRTSFQRQRCVS